ncbi:hypothetical protein EV697_10585 [Bisgaardia hudsonensis]|uniref:Purine nucleoside phosphorylase n=1 Tax=Bisgaardia hudsonensis TaxID=109472 RepID=A0A4R2MV20_9PAST|nr:peptidoglycan editing factor PgeF [Bisgaardia hudsonensis]QLB13641.1 multi-copper polyphenol oxidoreductase [Bisgaardia hudsonensis]TCP11973.1 hypothetical protein EV697_10585 [Bisgaardia hudsonensis]
MKKIQPNWLVPKNVHGFTTTREGGVSLSPYASFNLGEHVGDDKSAVKNNRTLLVEQFSLPQQPLYLNQIHSTKVVTLPYDSTDLNVDAVYTNVANQVCLVMTADCLPVLLTNKQGNEVAAIHAGWRGLCDGILEETINYFQCPKNEIVVWLGPAISQRAFQVGDDVVTQFIEKDPQAEKCFIVDPKEKGKYLGDLYGIAKQRLNNLGISQIFGGEHCTYTEKELFFSYRRDGKTGRMASLIWFE